MITWDLKRNKPLQTVAELVEDVKKKNSKKKPAIRREKTHHQKKSFLSLLLIKIGI
jgi:hypothetical protein